MLKFLFLFVLSSSYVFASGSETIERVIDDYFQGYQTADTFLIQKAFHSDTKLLSVDDNKLDTIEMSDWLKSLEERKLKGDIRKGKLRIESIDITHESAIVKLKIRFPKFEFTDYLSLLRIDHKWIIVGKIYHYQAL